MARIVSLLPGATEIVCALGLEADLVGRSHECDFPTFIEQLPVVSKPRLNPSASGLEIDKSVKALVSQGLGVFEINAEQLRALNPDVIITQIQCEVCAVSEDDVRAAVGDWLSDAPQILSVRANSLEEVWQDIERLGRSLGRADAARQVTGSLRTRMDQLAKATKRDPPATTVLGIEWVQPLMASGNWVPELMIAAGGQAVLAEAGQHSPWIEWDEIEQANPDIIIVSPCGFSLERAAAEASHLFELPGWSDLKAVREARVYAFEGHHYLHRPGPRLVDSAEFLARIISGDTHTPNNRAFRALA